VLSDLGRVVRISGAPWLPPGGALETPINNLTAKILCKRHNEALGPLDAEAGHFFEVLRTALVDLQRRTLSRKPVFHLVSGEAIELWMLKVACGLYFGGIASKEGTPLKDSYSIDIDKVVRAFFLRRWESRAGLYFHGTVGTKVSINNHIGVAPLSDDKAKFVAGATISLRGFALDLIFDMTNANRAPWTGLTYHPTELVLSERGRQHSIALTWPPGTPPRSVRLQSPGGSSQDAA
jgi:hypothetical protein